MIDIKLILDIVILVSLFMTMIYAYRLHSQLKEFNANKEELKVFLSSFGESLRHTKMGIREIKSIGESISIDIKKKLSEARKVKDELNFFVDRADKAIDDLNKKILQTKDVNKVNDPNVAGNSIVSSVAASNKSIDEKVSSNVLNRINNIIQQEEETSQQKQQEESLKRLKNIR